MWRVGPRLSEVSPQLWTVIGAVVGAVGCIGAPYAAQCERIKVVEKKKTIGVDKNRAAAVSYDGNAPNEDRFCVQLLDGKKLGLGVFDGHGGHQVAQYLSTRLMPKIQESVRALNNEGKDADMLAVSEALKDAFHHCEEDLRAAVGPAEQNKCPRLGAMGSCALCILVDSQHLYVANTGDCQALLVRAKDHVALCNAHNADNPSEQERLKKEHPEDDILMCHRRMEDVLSSCYVKGRLQATRTFGDFYMKDQSFQFHFETGKPFINPPLSYPYITATPEVQMFSREPGDQLLILASDGLWDYLSYSEVVHIVRNFFNKAEPDACEKIAQVLIDVALARAASENQMDMGALFKIPPGPKRRQIHDDITVVTARL